MRKYRWLFIMAMASVLSILNSSQVLAKEASTYPDIFRLSLSATPTTLDPQQTFQLENYELRRHFFDPLFTLKDGQVLPVLLDSYRWKTPTRWEFSLKQGVLFHDGSELTSQDVLATFNRSHRLKNDLYESTGNYQIRALDDYRFEVESQRPDSELLANLEDVVIIKHTAEQADSDGFNGGEHLIGTGPYRLIERQGFKEFRLEAFPDYHRGAAFIKYPVISVEPDPEKRLADFLSGKLDLVFYAAAQGLSGLQHKANITNETSHFLYLLSLDTWRDQSPEVRGPEGERLSRNPLQDLRVRQAISKALNREQLLLQLLGSKNTTQIAGQLVNENVALHDPSLLPDKQNISEAKRLLKVAGYPEGFQMTIRDSNTRRRYLDAIVPMLAQVGIEAKVSALPSNEYFKGVDSRAFSAMFYFQGAGGDLGEMLTTLLRTGSEGNSGGYSNPVLDQQIDDAMSQISTDLKDRKLREAQRTAMADLGVIPILFRSENWLVRPDMIFLPTDQLFTEAYYVRSNASE